MRGQHLSDPAIETLDHPVRLRRAWFGQSVLNLQRCTQPVEFMLATGRLLPVEQAVGEFAAVIGQDGAYVAGCRLLKRRQEGACRGGGLVRPDLHEDPAGGPVDGYKQIAAYRLVRHLRQVFDVKVEIAGVVRFERLAHRSGWCRLQIAQAAHTMPAQATIQTRARRCRVEKLADDDQQVIQSRAQDLAQLDSDAFLYRRQRDLQAMRGVGAIPDVLAMLSFADGIDGDVVTSGQFNQRAGGLPDFGTDDRRGASLLVKSDDHFDWALSVARSLPKPSRVRVGFQMRLLR